MNSRTVAGVLSALALGAVIAACGGAGDADTAPHAEETPPAASPAANPAADDVASYRLTMPAIRRWHTAHLAVYRALAASPDRAAELETIVEEARTINELETRLGGIPEVRAAVGQAGLGMREYVTITLAYHSAMAADALTRGGADRAQTVQETGVDPANLELVAQNRSELERLQQQIEELAGS